MQVLYHYHQEPEHLFRIGLRTEFTLREAYAFADYLNRNGAAAHVICAVSTIEQFQPGAR
jgi:hypothetical protein